MSQNDQNKQILLWPFHRTDGIARVKEELEMKLFVYAYNLLAHQVVERGKRNNEIKIKLYFFFLP